MLYESSREGGGGGVVGVCSICMYRYKYIIYIASMVSL